MSSTVLYYDCAPDPFPLQQGMAGASIEFLATNQTAAAVTLDAVTVGFPIGDDTDELVATSDAGSVTALAPAGWGTPQVTNDGTTLQAVFPAPPGGATVPANSSLTFTLNAIQANGSTGSVEITVTEYVAGSQTPDSGSVTLEVSKFPSQWGTVSFDLDYTDIQPGGGVTLSWNGPQGATYTISYTLGEYSITVPQEGQGPLSNMGTYPTTPLVLDQTTTFTLDVDYKDSNGNDYHAQTQRTATVATPPPVIASFGGSIQELNGQPSLVLQWSTTNASSCTLSGTVVPTNSTSHPISLALGGPSSYTLTATNSSGQTTSTINLEWQVQAGVVTWDQASGQSSAAGIALSWDKKTAYVCTSYHQSVVVIDCASLTTIQEVDVSNALTAAQLAVAMPGGSLVVTGGYSEQPWGGEAALLVPASGGNLTLSTFAGIELQQWVGNNLNDMIGAPPIALAATPNLLLAISPFASMGLYLATPLPSLAYGNTVPLSTSADGPAAAAASLDSNRAYIAWPTELAVLDLTQSPPAQVGSVLSLESPASSIAVTTIQGTETLCMAIPGSGVVQFVSYTGSSTAPLSASTSVSIPGASQVALSPDKSFLAVLGSSGGAPAVYLVSLAGGTPALAAGPISLPQSATSLVAVLGLPTVFVAVGGDSSTQPGLYTVSQAVSGGVAQAAASASAS